MFDSIVKMFLCYLVLYIICEIGCMWVWTGACGSVHAMYANKLYKT